MVYIRDSFICSLLLDFLSWWSEKKEGEVSNCSAGVSCDFLLPIKRKEYSGFAKIEVNNHHRMEYLHVYVNGSYSDENYLCSLFPGRLLVTNLRIIWRSLSLPRVNLCKCHHLLNDCKFFCFLYGGMLYFPNTTDYSTE